MNYNVLFFIFVTGKESLDFRPEVPEETISGTNIQSMSIRIDSHRYAKIENDVMCMISVTMCYNIKSKLFKLSMY